MFTMLLAGLRTGQAIRASVMAAMLLAVWVSMQPVGTAQAEEVLVGDCFHSFGDLSCALRWGKAGDPYVRRVPGPRDAKEEAEFARHDRNWEARCRPIVKRDGFGVSRYQYAAAGCEFGVED